MGRCVHPRQGRAERPSRRVLKARLLKAEPLDRAELASIRHHELITRGIGYLSRPKDVTPKDGDPFLSCTVAALAGPVDEPEYRYFDTIVTTPEAEHLVRRCVQAIEGDCKVLIAFRLNDMKIDPYIRTKGERAGEPAASLESTLIHIGLIKIDGTKVYPTSPAQAETPPAQDASASEAETPAPLPISLPSPPSASPKVKWRSRSRHWLLRSDQGPRGPCRFPIAKENHHGSHIGIR